MLILRFFVWTPSLCCVWSLPLNQPRADSVWGRWKVLLVYLSHLPFHNGWQCRQECCSAALCSPALNIYTWGLSLWYPTSVGRVPSEKFLLVLKMSRRRTGPLWACVGALPRCATNRLFIKKKKKSLVIAYLFNMFWETVVLHKSKPNPSFQPNNVSLHMSQFYLLRFFVWEILSGLKCFLCLR